MLDQAENQYKNLHFHILLDTARRLMKVYTISTLLSSSIREKRENKISSPFQLNKKSVIFKAVKIHARSDVKHNFSKNEVLVIFSSTLWLTYEKKYFFEDFEDNSK